jgi:hypothetical protein
MSSPGEYTSPGAGSAASPVLSLPEKLHAAAAILDSVEAPAQGSSGR